MESQELQTQHYLRIFWRRKGLILLATLIAAGSAFALSTIVSPPTEEATAATMYEARTTVVLSPPADGSPLAEALQGNIETQIQLMRSRSVLQRAIAILHEGGEPPSQDTVSSQASALAEVVSVEPIDDTNLVEVRARAGNPELAQRLADALVAAYDEHIKAVQKQSIEEALRATRESLRTAQEGAPDLAAEASGTLALLDRQVNFSLSLLNDDTVALNDLANEITTTQQSVADDISRELPIQLQTLTELTSGLDELSRQVRAEGMVSAADRIDTVHSNLLSVRESLNTLLEQASSGADVSDGTLRNEANSALTNAATSLESANQQLGAVIGLAGLSPASRGELQGLASLVPPAHRGITTLAQEVANVPDGPLAADRFRFASELLGDIATRLDAMEADAATVTNASLADLEGRTRAAIQALAELRGALEAEGPETLDSDNEVRLAAAIEHLQQSEARLTEAVDSFASIGEGVDPPIGELTAREQDLERQLLNPIETGVQVIDPARAFPVVEADAAVPLSDGGRIALGALVGLLIGLIGALGLEYGDKSVRSEERLATRAGLRSLGAVPRFPRTHRGIPLRSNGEPFELFDEALHAVATNVEEQTGGSPGLLLVASPRVRSGSTTVALNLARLFSRRQRSTLLVDANLRKPDLTRMLGLQEYAGLAAVLEGWGDLPQSVVEGNGLHILPAGEAAASAVELLSSPALRNVLQEAQRAFDVVIIDSAPVLGFAETTVLARQVGQALVMANARRTSLADAEEATERLKGVGVRVLGAVVTEVNPKALQQLESREYQRSRRESGNGRPALYMGRSATRTSKTLDSSGKSTRE